MWDKCWRSALVLSLEISFLLDVSRLNFTWDSAKLSFLHVLVVGWSRCCDILKQTLNISQISAYKDKTTHLHESGGSFSTLWQEIWRVFFRVETGFTSSLIFRWIFLHVYVSAHLHVPHIPTLQQHSSFSDPTRRLLFFLWNQFGLLWCRHEKWVCVCVCVSSFPLCVCTVNVYDTVGVCVCVSPLISGRWRAVAR